MSTNLSQLKTLENPQIIIILLHNIDISNSYYTFSYQENDQTSFIKINASYVLNYTTICLFSLPNSSKEVCLDLSDSLKARKMGIDARPFCVWEWQEEAGRKGGIWATYVNLSDCYVNNATHNYQGIKCVPCINKIMLHWGGKNRKKQQKKGQNVRHQNKWNEQK